MTAIHHCLSAKKTGKFRVLPEFGPEGGAQRKCNTRNINHVVYNSYKDELCSLNTDFRFSSPEVQSKEIDNICSGISQRMHSTGTGPAMAQPGNNQGSFDEELLDYILQKQIEQPDNSFNHLSCFVVATEASVRFSAILSMERSAIASSSQLIPCSNSNSNSNSNDITNITNITSNENTGLVDGNMIVYSATLLGG